MKNEDNMRASDVDCLKRMLRVKELPKQVMEEYFKVKSIMDRVDAAIGPYGLQDIIRKAEARTGIAIEPTEEAEDEKREDAPEEVSQTKEETKVEDDDWPEWAYAKGTEGTVFYENKIEKAEVLNAYKDDNDDLMYDLEVVREGKEDVTVAREAEDFEIKTE